MTQRTLAVLVVLNAVLLAAIALTFSSGTPAQAQIGGGGYLMIAGNDNGIPNQQVIYIMNTGNGRVAALLVDGANGNITPIGGRSIADDLNAGGGGR